MVEALRQHETLLAVCFTTLSCSVISLVVIWVLLKAARETMLSKYKAEETHLRAEYEIQLSAAKTITHEEEKALRKDAISRSTSTVTGQIMERICPHLQGFPFNPRDIRFLGDPFDYVAMPGYSEGEIKEIVILEVKTGKGSLNTRQRQIRDRIAEGKVRWEVCHIDPNGTIDNPE